MVTHEVTPTLKVEQGNITANPHRDIIKYVVFDRYGSNQIARGFLAGTGIKRGAWASTLNWECYQPTVIGADDEEMATAFNRLLEIKSLDKQYSSTMNSSQTSYFPTSPKDMQ